MKALFIVTFLVSLSVKAQSIPPEVEALVTDIKENLNPGHHLRQSREHLFRLIDHRGGDTWSEIHGIDPQLADSLTEDEMMDYIARRTNFALICKTESYIRQLQPWPPSVCQEGLPKEIWGASVETRERFTELVTFMDAHSASLEEFVTSFTSLPDWMRLDAEVVMVRNSNKDGDIVTGEMFEAMMKNHFGLDNYAIVYTFELMNSEIFGVVGFVNGQAKLLQMMMFDDDNA